MCLLEEEISVYIDFLNDLTSLCLMTGYKVERIQLLLCKGRFSRAQTFTNTRKQNISCTYSLVVYEANKMYLHFELQVRLEIDTGLYVATDYSRLIKCCPTMQVYCILQRDTRNPLMVNCSKS